MRERDVETLFEQFGKVNIISICGVLTSRITDQMSADSVCFSANLDSFSYYFRYDPMTKESRGFGFVTYEDNTGASAAKQALNGSTHEGRMLTVEMVLSVFAVEKLICAGQAWQAEKSYSWPVPGRTQIHLSTYSFRL
jgi:RNA recognition motif-containing protein